MAIVTSDEEFRTKLVGEVRAWQRSGLISPERAEAILARYELRAPAGRAFRLGPVASFVSFVGAAALAIGILIYFAAIWHVLPSWSRTTLIVGSTTAAFGAGYWLKYRGTLLTRVGTSLFFLGAVLLQAGLFLLADTYHLGANSPILLLIGTTAILPLAFLIRSQVLCLFALLDGLAWIGYAWERAYPKPPESFGVPFIYILAGVILYVVGRRLAAGHDLRPFQNIFLVLGLVVIFVPTYILTFSSFWQQAQSQQRAHLHDPVWFLAIIALALVGAGSLVVDRQHDQRAPAEAGALAILTLSVALVAYAPLWADGYTLLYNVLFFALAVLLGVRGYQENGALYVNAALVVLAVGLFTRYCDTVFPLIPRSAFFAVGGLFLLFAGGGLETLRRRLLATMRTAMPA